MAHAISIFFVFVLCAGAVLCALVALFYPRVSKNYPLNQRLELIAPTGNDGRFGLRGNENSDAARKRSIEDTLRKNADVAAAKAKQAKPSLAARLRQSQLNWSKTTYWAICFVVAVVTFFLILVTGLGPVPAVGFGVALGMYLPHWYVNFKRRRYFKKFTANLADAVDIVVRGVKVGLPLIECFKIVAREARSPIKEEFQVIVEDQLVGMPLAEATERLPERVPIAEARFFSIVIAIQSRSGGSLAETLGNLSKVLRDRQKMFDKIKALSSESKASAYIIAALPLVVIGALAVVSPSYIALLFTEKTGHVVLVVCALLMVAGTLVMRKMINFDF
jgi:tight adherence protein B